MNRSQKFELMNDGLQNIVAAASEQFQCKKFDKLGHKSVGNLDWL